MKGIIYTATVIASVVILLVSAESHHISAQNGTPG